MINKVSRSSILNTVWAMVGLAVPTLVQFLYLILAARALPAHDFGNLMITFAVATITMALSGVGAGGVALRWSARQHERAGSYFSQALLLTLLTLLPVLAITVAIIWFVAPEVPIWLAVSVGLSELFCWRNAMTCQQIFIALGQQARAALMGLAIPTARLAAAALVLLAHPDAPLLVLGVSYIAAALIAMVACIAYTYRKVGYHKGSLSGFDFVDGFSFVTLWLNTAVQVECDKLILSYFGTPTDVGIYSIASRLMDGAFNPPRALRIAMQSRLYREGAEGHKKIYNFMLKLLPINIAYGLFAWAVAALFAPWIMVLFDEQYAELVHILPIIGALPLLRAIADIGSEIFVTSDRAAFQAAMQVGATLIRVVLGIILIASYGVYGAVYAALAASAIGAALFWGAAVIFARRT